MILSKQDAALFFKLNWSLLYYVNQKYPVIKGLRSPDLKDQDANKIIELHETFYSHLELIDSFITENPFGFNHEELEIIESWKKSIKDRFFIISHQKDYTIFLQQDKIPIAYGVLGQYDKIKNIIPKTPVYAETILLPFKGKIIHSGVITGPDLQLSPTSMDKIRKDYLRARNRFGIIRSLDEPIYPDESFADLIESEVGMDWDQMEADLPEMATEKLVEVMVALELYVNQTFAKEIAKRGDAVFWLRKLTQNGRYRYREDYGSGWTPIHSIHLLPLIKSKEALELLLDIIRYRSDDLDDWLTESVGGLLAAFGKDAIEDLKRFSSDETLEAFVRNAATTALAFLASKTPSYKDDIKEHLMDLFNATSDATFASLVADDIASFHDPSVMPQIRRAFEENRMDELIESEEELELVIAGKYDDLLYYRCEEDPLNHFSRKNIEYLHSLHHSKPDEEDDNEFDEDEAFDFKTKEKPKKIGRNDPCPCGSGKKYKKCCMGKEA